jgi:hypothetical protein
MKTCKGAGMILAVVLAIAPAAFGGGLGDVNLPDGRFHEGSNATNSEVKGTHHSLSTNFYAPSDQSDAGRWSVTPYWWGYPFGLAVFNKE